MFNIISDNVDMPYITCPHNNSKRVQNGINDKLTGLLSLPIELHRQIAMTLNANDYAHLRQSCSTLSNNLYSFPQLHNILKKYPCTGTFKAQSEKLLIESKFKNPDDKDKHIIEAIKNIEKIYREGTRCINRYATSISIKTGINEQKDLVKTFQKISDYMGERYFTFKQIFNVSPEKSCFQFIFSVDNHGYLENETDFPAEWMSSALQAVFNHTTHNARYVVAALAAEMIQEWINIPPRKVDTLRVKNINLCHKKLIDTGNLVRSSELGIKPY